jgi:SsrA-binding protein
MHIAVYSHGNRNNHDPLRRRKLLLHRQELNRLLSAVTEKGFTLVPTKLYWVNGRVKVEIALGKGKNKGDKRDDVKSRDAQREIDHATKRSR